MLKPFLDRIALSSRRGDAREESYYPALEALLMEFGHSTNRLDTHVTVLPKKTDAGNPDFRIWDGTRKIVGYVEAKVPEKKLDEVENTEQIARYRATFPNFILTNFIEFRLYRDGINVDKISVSDLASIIDSRKVVKIEGQSQFECLLEKFFSFSQPSITTTEVLATELAKRTRFLRDEVIAEEIVEEEKSGNKLILGFYEAFQTYLIRGLTQEQFADLYSQTITYGLFASRMRGGKEFNRKIAVHDIPHTIGILRDIFEFISLGNLPPQMEWIIDEIADVLANVDVKGIFAEYFRTRKGEDPVFPFYETFLTQYDPEAREKRGVYYTPEPVVSYIVRSLHLLLKKEFRLTEGLAEKNVTILDPAGGTLTFLAQAVKEAAKAFTTKYGDGGKEKFIKEHILSDFYAFELLIAPYAIGHLKMSFLLEEMGYRLDESERLKFYLTNTLEMEDISQTSLPGTASLSEESHLAGAIKKKTPILIILGNPPYSGHSDNIGEWISQEIQEYYKVDGESLHEKNTKWLQDDYVKFIRFAQWKIDQAGKGVVGFITNHGYLDSPIFRGMRQSLLKSFDEIYILNLHGNSNQKEKTPDGGKDENVFDIQQGVAIAFFVKKSAENKHHHLHHADLWGQRQHKYNWLTKNDVNTTKWKSLKPSPSEYLFVPRDETLRKSYESFVSIPDIFTLGSIAVQTHRDNFAVDFDRNRLEERIKSFRDTRVSDEMIMESMDLKETDAWKIKEKRRKIKEDNNWETRVMPFCFHPFDIRWIFYHEQVVDRDRWQVMQHMLIPNNLGLNCSREFAYEVNSYNYALISNAVTNDRVFVSNKGAAYFFPLYALAHQRRERNMTVGTTVEKKSNVNPIVVSQLQNAYGKKPTPEEILYYVYGVLYSEVYRKRYIDFLKTNFPKIPFTADTKIFVAMARYGQVLANLHLFMPEEQLGKLIARYEGRGDNVIIKPVYDAKKGRVFINEQQYFEGIKQDLWEYQVGGYQVLYQWLKDRKSRILSLEDIRQYCKIATCLTRTREIQVKIDKIYLQVENNIVKIEKAPSADLTHYS